MRLENKTALITAAGQGIGRATVARFRAEGARVIAADIDIASLADEPGIEVHALDVTDPAAIARLRDQLPRLDVLFNCAGMVPAGSVLDCERSLWQTSFDLNVTSMFDMIRAFLPGMRASGG
ncbi:SDR family NAD(P)-dependent oxidoreductase, partial [Salinisphaera sp.]|uniref:SDR family NAD(P)-dependent oxidoreductase n=1 Tax=Salinisphaera sp. TaxID=1914330 RepID=UPI002D783C0D